MLVELILVVVLLTVCVALIWPGPGRPGGGSVRDVRFPSGVKPSPDPWPDNPEGTLVRQLQIGEITRSQYLRAMSRLAERDGARHPLEVPGD